jgi:hypothetical protein
MPLTLLYYFFTKYCLYLNLIITIGFDFNKVYYVLKKTYSLVTQGFLVCFHFQILCDHVSLVIVMSRSKNQGLGQLLL